MHVNNDVLDLHETHRECCGTTFMEMGKDLDTTKMVELKEIQNVGERPRHATTLILRSKKGN